MVEALKKLAVPSPSTPRVPPNGVTTPSKDRIQEAVDDAHDPRRLVTARPSFSVW